MPDTAGRDPASLERRNGANGYQRAQARAFDAIMQVLSRAAYDPGAVGDALGNLDNTELRLVCTTLALLVDDHLTLRQLHSRAREAFDAYPCHPALWGPSWSSRAEHGTRSRYGAGCRGDACRAADLDYRKDRHAPPAAEGPALAVVGR